MPSRSSELKRMLRMKLPGRMILMYSGSDPLKILGRIRSVEIRGIELIIVTSETQISWWGKYFEPSTQNHFAHPVDSIKEIAFSRNHTIYISTLLKIMIVMCLFTVSNSIFYIGTKNPITAMRENINI